MTAQRALRITALVGVLWRLYLVLPTQHILGAIIAVSLGAAPYAIAAVFAQLWKVEVAAAFVGVGALLLDVGVGLAALRSTSSTAGVAIMLEPLVAAGAAAPALAVAALAARRRPPRRVALSASRPWR